MPSSEMRILVTGATGLIGCHATAQLVAAGHEVRAFVCDAPKLDRVLAPFGGPEGLGPKDVELAFGDLGDRTSLVRALEGCRGLLHCAGLFSPDLASAALLAETNVEGTRRVLEAGSAASLERIVYVSSILALFPPAGARMTADDRADRRCVSVARRSRSGCTADVRSRGGPDPERAGRRRRSV